MTDTTPGTPLPAAGETGLRRFLRRRLTLLLSLLMALIVAFSVVAFNAHRTVSRNEHTQTLVQQLRADGNALSLQGAILLTDVVERRPAQSQLTIDSRDVAAVVNALDRIAALRLGASAERLPAVKQSLRRLLATGALATVATGDKPKLTALPALERDALAFSRELDALSDSISIAAVSARDAANSRVRLAVAVIVLAGIIALALIADRIAELQRIVAMRDVKRATEASNEARLAALLDHSSDVVFVIDGDCTIRWSAASVRHVLGFDPASVQGQRLDQLADPDQADQVRRFVDRSLAGEDSEPLSFRVRHARDGWRTVEAVPSNQLENQAITGLVLNLRNVTEREALTDELRDQAYHDPLTRLANRALLERRLQLSSSELGAGRRLAVLFLDVNDFKAVNDTLGHRVGDEVLSEVARRIARSVRARDLAVRIGGDEFAVLVEIDGDPDVVERLRGRILRAFGEPLVIGGQQLPLSVSLGVATGAENACFDELLHRADLDMYSSKAEAKAASGEFIRRLQALASERSGLARDLDGALLNGQMKVVYDPIFGLVSGWPIAVEAHLVWHHPVIGMLGAEQFMGLTDAVGEQELCNWGLQVACEQSLVWQQQNNPYPLVVFVKQSVKALHAGELERRLRSVLGATGLDPRLISIGFDAEMVLADQVALNALPSLTDLGVLVALDDFDVGYSSVATLTGLPIGAVRLDAARWFGGIDGDPYRATLVADALDALAQRSIEIVVGDVQSDLLRHPLTAGRPVMVQGPYYGPPLSAAGVDGLLAAHSDRLATAAGPALPGPAWEQRRLQRNKQLPRVV